MVWRRSNFLTDVIAKRYNLLSFSKAKIEISFDLNIISVGEKTNQDVDFLDIEGIGLERYTVGLNYLIRPDGYIVGIFEETNIETIERFIL